MFINERSNRLDWMDGYCSVYLQPFRLKPGLVHIIARGNHDGPGTPAISGRYGSNQESNECENQS